jgi:DNA-binding transcriptional regulator YdaS (Cro superfamily)
MNIEPVPMPVQQAIDRAGGMRTLAEKIGIRYQAVQKWRRTGKVPAERVLAVEEATGVSRYDLRPDLYPREAAA